MAANAASRTAEWAAVVHLLLVVIPQLLHARYGMVWGIADGLAANRPGDDNFQHPATTTAIENMDWARIRYAWLGLYQVLGTWVGVQCSLRFMMMKSRTRRSRIGLHASTHAWLLGSTICTLGAMGAVQNYYHSPMVVLWDHSYCRMTLGTLGLAVLASVYALMEKKAPNRLSAGVEAVVSKPSVNRSAPMKWSIPANSIFWGGVAHALMAVASFQMLYQGTTWWAATEAPQNHGNSDHDAVLWLGADALVKFLHAMVLFRCRVFLSRVSQLRTLCAVQVLWHAHILFGLLYYYAMKSSSSTTTEENGPVSSSWLLFLDHNPNPYLQIILSGGLVINYFLGYVCAGQAQGVSRILTSEKDD